MIDLRRRAGATLVGCTAIAMWSTLALFSTAAAGVPSFELLAIVFAFPAAAGAARALARRARGARIPLSAALIGTVALFAFHALYIFALRRAPPERASLVSSLWPLLLVLFTAALPEERLRAGHVAGAASGFAGTALLVGGGAATASVPGSISGYAAAFACAVVWAAFSVLQRRMRGVPSDAVVVYCAGTAIASLAFHLALEPTIAPSAREWAAMAALGVGPMGLAFVAWDHGTKHGDIQLLGAFAYAGPLGSTLLLVATGHAEPRWQLFAAAIAISGGGALAGWQTAAAAAERPSNATEVPEPPSS